jgi:hypothetical protein
MTKVETMRCKFALLIFATLAVPAQAADAPAAKPLDLVPIELARGITQIPSFTQDGRPARVLKAWRENGNGHGYFTYVITISGGAGQEGDWNLVPVTVPTPWSVQDTLTDAPHTFEDVARSVRFARGRLDEQAEVLLFTATREIANSYADPTPVTFELYRVVVTDEMGDVLERVRSWRSAKNYCNADMALLREVGLRLPPGYEGGEGETGCL